MSELLIVQSNIYCCLAISKIANWTEPSGSMTAPDVSVRTMVVELLLQWWYLCKRLRGGGNGDHHDVEVY
jgi:hypothetical protein